MVKRNSSRWVPTPGSLASYTGRTSRLLRGGRLLEIVAEATTARMVVSAIGHNGRPVKITVLKRNLGQPQPQLFE
jgi:hypothetical protein